MIDDDLIDPNYISGDPNQEYDPTARAGDVYNENYLGNAPGLTSMNEYTAPHGVNTLVFGELIETGYDWGRDEWESYTLDEKTTAWLRPRINEKIERRFWYREIGASPVKRWQSLFIYNINEALDELGPIYRLLRMAEESEAGGLDLLDTGLGEEKGTTVASEFPQARLKMTQEDYASNSVEVIRQNVAAISQLDAIYKYNQQYTELDKRLLDSISRCFSSLHTSPLGGYYDN